MTTTETIGERRRAQIWNYWMELVENKEIDPQGAGAAILAEGIADGFDLGSIGIALEMLADDAERKIAAMRPRILGEKSIKNLVSAIYNSPGIFPASEVPDLARKILAGDEGFNVGGFVVEQAASILQKLQTPIEQTMIALNNTDLFISHHGPQEVDFAFKRMLSRSERLDVYQQRILTLPEQLQNTSHNNLHRHFDLIMLAGTVNLYLNGIDATAILRVFKDRVAAQKPIS